jgi:hypothetical protein
MKLEFSVQRAELLHAGGRSDRQDRQTDMTKLAVAFRNFLRLHHKDDLFL